MVYVWARDQHDILTLNPFPLVHFVRSVQAAMRGPKGRGHGSTIDIQRTPGGQRYFMSEGARFLVEHLLAMHGVNGIAWHTPTQVVNGLWEKWCRELAVAARR